MVKVGVIGHTGRLGKPLVEILNRHPSAKVVYTESRGEGIHGNSKDPELFFLALPRGESSKYLCKVEGKKVIDLSDDHRTAEGWVYGLPELNRESIKNAQKVTAPGCYATSIILGLAPIAKYVSKISIASISGISGAGLKVQEQDNFIVYKDGRAHQQIPEIEKILGLNDILFVPQRIDTADRGLTSIIFADFDSSEELSSLYKNFYSPMPFIRIVQNIKTKNVNGTNFCDIKVSRYYDRIFVISALDNIIKGGSGQAVQNFNLMCGFDETTGLH